VGVTVGKINAKGAGVACNHGMSLFINNQHFGVLCKI
jgi:hypothetical protein